MHASRIFSATVIAIALASWPAVGADVTSNAGPVSDVYTRTTDVPFTVPASGGFNFPVAFDLKHRSTLIINVSLRGVANSDREWGINCSGSTVTCEPFAGLEEFSAGSRNMLSFTVVARNVPKGPGTVNLFVFANCNTACSGSEALNVETLVAVVAAARQ